MIRGDSVNACARACVCLCGVLRVYYVQVRVCGAQYTVASIPGPGLKRRDELHCHVLSLTEYGAGLRMGITWKWERGSREESKVGESLNSRFVISRLSGGESAGSIKLGAMNQSARVRFP